MFTNAFRAVTFIACTVVPIYGQTSEENPDSADPSHSLATAVTDLTVQQGAILEVTNPTAVANCAICSGLVSSTGNLYFTSYGINEFGPDSTSFYRTGKTSSPGTEGLLYREQGDRPGFYYFGSVVWAKPDTYYGYFVANYNDFGVHTSQIKRAPLAGGNAIILAAAPAYIGSRIC